MSSIINVLAGELMNDSSVKQIAKASGVKAKEAENVIGNAIPLLVQAMSDNAGTKEGAESLYGALGDHKCDKSAADQLKNADTVDGDKIIGKILGENKQGVTDALAKQAGITRGNTASILALLAPVLLSLIGSQTSNNNTSSGGLSSLLSLFTDDDIGQDNGTTSSNSGMGDIGTALLMSALMGGNSSSGSGNLLSSMLGGGNSSSGSGLGGALLSSMLGGGGNSGSSTGLDGALLGDNSSNSDNGADLLSALLGGGSSNNNSSGGSFLSSVLGGGGGNLLTSLLVDNMSDMRSTSGKKAGAKKKVSAKEKEAGAKLLGAVMKNFLK